MLIFTLTLHSEFEISPIIEVYEEIYFANDNGHYLKSPQTKSFFHKFAVSLIITVVLIIVSLSISNFSFDSAPTTLLLLLMILFCIGQIVTIIFFLGFMQKALEIKQWKKQIRNYLKKLKVTTVYKVILTDSYFTIIQDDTEKILSWSSITKAELNSEYISLEGQENFFVPAKCITQGNYPELRKTLSEKLKHATVEPQNS